MITISRSDNVIKKRLLGTFVFGHDSVYCTRDLHLIKFRFSPTCDAGCV